LLLCGPAFLRLLGEAGSDADHTFFAARALVYSRVGRG
jgi:hypothetical protein